MIFKYFLFFDIIWGGNIPKEINNKLYFFLTNKRTLNSGEIKKDDYIILKRRYIEQNDKIESKIYAIFEFKDELRTKYFSEKASLKLGYNQKDIIDKKINRLMPKMFYQSHLNAIKQILETK